MKLRREKERKERKGEERKKKNKREKRKVDKASKGWCEGCEEGVVGTKGTTILLPTNMCFHLFAQFPELPIGHPTGIASHQGDRTLDRFHYGSYLVGKLIEKGWDRESKSPCVVLVILVPKKDGF
ncbi:hypothetical protein CR513_46866, partial [Mucuna pruriens]